MDQHVRLMVRSVNPWTPKTCLDERKLLKHRWPSKYELYLSVASHQKREKEHTKKGERLKHSRVAGMLLTSPGTSHLLKPGFHLLKDFRGITHH